MNTTYRPIIGLEVHVVLKTNTKMFCGCSADYFGQKPNTHTCPVCLGLPGALPVPNRIAIEWCVMIALALNCEINEFSKFDRKNYFYPDLPKGYQISQYDLPFGKNGYVILGRSERRHQNPQLDPGQAPMQSGSRQVGARMTGMGKKIRIRRVHMEEDTAKLVHELGMTNDQFPKSNEKGISLIDFNRSGVPLVEIVTEPDFDSADDVVEYLKKLQTIVRYLGVSNADMEKGNMRLEPNISLKEVVILGTQSEAWRTLGSQGDSGQARMTDDLPPYKVEVKNINSFRFVEKAINFEVDRQEMLLRGGQTPLQETRGWNEARNATVSQRAKEEANDYRYFPEPDIPPIRMNQEQISNLRSSVPELQDSKLVRFIAQFNLAEYDAEILTREKELADYFEEAVRVARHSEAQPKNLSTSLSQSDIRQRSFANAQDDKLSPKAIANWIINKRIKTADVLPAKLIKDILESTQTEAIDEAELQKIISSVIEANPKAVADYKNGKETVIMFLVGQVMRQVGKKIDAQMVKTQLIEQLK